MGIPLLVVLSFDVADPEQTVDILASLDPPSHPHFTGQARVVVGDDVAATIRFLDTDEVIPQPADTFDQALLNVYATSFASGALTALVGAGMAQDVAQARISNTITAMTRDPVYTEEILTVVRQVWETGQADGETKLHTIHVNPDNPLPY